MLLGSWPLAIILRGPPQNITIPWQTKQTASETFPPSRGEQHIPNAQRERAHTKRSAQQAFASVKNNNCFKKEVLHIWHLPEMGDCCCRRISERGRAQKPQREPPPAAADADRRGDIFAEVVHIGDGGEDLTISSGW